MKKTNGPRGTGDVSFVIQNRHRLHAVLIFVLFSLRPTTCTRYTRLHTRSHNVPTPFYRSTADRFISYEFISSLLHLIILFFFISSTPGETDVVVFVVANKLEVNLSSDRSSATGLLRQLCTTGPIIIHCRLSIAAAAHYTLLSVRARNYPRCTEETLAGTRLNR